MKKINKYFINSKIYPISDNSTITTLLLSATIDQFWSDVYDPLYQKNNDLHLVLMCKVNYLGSIGGYRTLAPSRRVNYNDKTLFIDYINSRINYLNDSYTITPCSSIELTYVIGKGVADDNRLLKQNFDYQVATYNFNNYQLPLSMDPKDYGVLVGTMDLGDKTRYIVKTDVTVFSIEAAKDGSINHTRIEGVADITWIDTKLDDYTFKRDLETSTLYIQDGKVVVKEKVLPAKAFTKGKLDKKISNSNIFITMDIETIIHNKEFKPYLICGYNESNFIQHTLNDPLNNLEVTQMFHQFINDVIKIKSLKYVYAHNLSAFDGIFLLKYLINHPKKIDVAPMIQHGKIKCITFKFYDLKNKPRTIVFKDSYLLLPVSLRDLCIAFGLLINKLHFPYKLTDINYTGIFPEFQYWSSDLSRSEYIKLHQQFGDKVWNFKDEALIYCKTDCISLFNILVKYNELIFNQFSMNVHKSITLPALAFKIFKAAFMPENTIFQIKGQVEQDIREAYTGGAVDVYIPHNHGWVENKDSQHVRNPEKINKFGKAITKVFTKLYFYDFVSLFPYLMAFFVVPVGKPIAFEGDIRSVDPNAHGFFYCNIETPEYLQNPFLQRRVKTNNGVRTVAGLGKWTGWIASNEYNIATEKLGYKITILKGYRFKMGNVFSEFIQALFKLRMTYKKDNPLNLIAKLLMNSVYGRFGMLAVRLITEIFDLNIREQNLHLKRLYKDHAETIKDNFRIDLHTYVIIRDKIPDLFLTENNLIDYTDYTDTNVAIAAWIAASSRCHMAPFKAATKFNLYYSDTDCIVIDKPLPEELVGNNLGDLKLEHVIEKAVFLAPKVYALITDQGEEIIKVKGLTQDAINKAKLGYNDFEQLLKYNEHIELNQEKFFKDINSGSVNIIESTYNLKATANKISLC